MALLVYLQVIEVILLHKVNFFYAKCRYGAISMICNNTKTNDNQLDVHFSKKFLSYIFYILSKFFFFSSYQYFR